MNYFIFFNLDVKHIFFTCVFLVNILYTVTSNKNVSNAMQHSNLTANESGTSINKTKKEKYNAYVDAEVQGIWQRYLAEAGTTEFKSFKGRKSKMKLSTAMRKDSAVTETISLAFSERGYNTGRETVKNIHITPKPGALSFGIGKKRPVYDTTGSPTTETENSNKSTNPMELFRDCDRTCNYYFKTYGRVCGHRYHMKYWRNEYKNFENICDIDHENCIHTHSNCHPMYRGNCSELLTFPKMEEEYVDIVERVKEWAPYVYEPPTASTKND